MDNRRTLSIIAQGARRASHGISKMDEQEVDIDESNSITIENLQRRRSSRVCLIV